MLFHGDWVINLWLHLFPLIGIPLLIVHLVYLENQTCYYKWWQEQTIASIKMVLFIALKHGYIWLKYKILWYVIKTAYKWHKLIKGFMHLKGRSWTVYYRHWNNLFFYSTNFITGKPAYISALHFSLINYY